jgi:hypothetical protein
MEKIYDMKLHECIDSGTKVNMFYTILRVAGGWIYTSFNHDGSSLSSIFVRFDNEFQSKP